MLVIYFTQLKFSLKKYFKKPLNQLTEIHFHVYIMPEEFSIFATLKNYSS